MGLGNGSDVWNCGCAGCGRLGLCRVVVDDLFLLLILKHEEEEEEEKEEEEDTYEKSQSFLLF